MMEEFEKLIQGSNLSEESKKRWLEGFKSLGEQRKEILFSYVKENPEELPRLDKEFQKRFNLISKGDWEGYDKLIEEKSKEIDSAIEKESREKEREELEKARKELNKPR